VLQNSLKQGGLTLKGLSIIIITIIIIIIIIVMFMSHIYRSIGGLVPESIKLYPIALGVSGPS